MTEECLCLSLVQCLYVFLSVTIHDRCIMTIQYLYVFVLVAVFELYIMRVKCLNIVAKAVARSFFVSDYPENASFF